MLSRWSIGRVEVGMVGALGGVEHWEGGGWDGGSIGRDRWSIRRVGALGC